MSPTARSRLLFLLKVLVAAVLLGWLLRSGAIDFSALGLYFERPSLLVTTVVLYFSCTLLATLRWHVLLRLAGAHLKFRRVVQLQLTALFFNIVVPGNVGGDVIKAIYAAREAPPERKATVYLVGFVDRLLGLAGLVLVAALVVIARGPSLWNDPNLHGLSLTVLGLAAATLIGPAVALLGVRYASGWLDGLVARPGAIWRIANQLLQALRLVASDPRRLVIALVFSMGVHVQAIALFTVVARDVLPDHDVSFAAVSSIYPIGILTLLLPISPAGVGVGHVAFDRLFTLAGLPSGATIFNIFLVGQLLPQLVGVFPYLTLRREGGMPTK